MAKDYDVGWHYAEKVESELLRLGEILLPKDIYNNKDYYRGPGARFLNSINVFVLYALDKKNTQRYLNSYVSYVFAFAVTIVSAPVVLRQSLHSLPV